MKKTKKAKIKNLFELAAVMEMTRSFLKLPDNDENPFVGAKGLKKQVESSGKKFPDKKQMLLFWLEPTENKDFDPNDPEDAPIEMVAKSSWFNKETNKAISEPRWWKKYKQDNPTLFDKMKEKST
jgi:hypothetical protein